MGQGFFKASYFNDLSKVEFTPEQKLAIEKEIKNEPIVLYSKSYCPHCIAAKRLLETHKVQGVKCREINLEEDGLQTQAILFSIYGQKSVPNVFIKGNHIGGNSDLQAMANSGKLKELLDNAGIAHEFQWTTRLLQKALSRTLYDMELATGTLRPL